MSKLATETTEFVAEAELGGVPLFSWASFVLLAINLCLMVVLYQQRVQLGVFAGKIAYHERLSAFYVFVMKQQGIDVDAIVPKEYNETTARKGRYRATNRPQQARQTNTAT